MLSVLRCSRTLLSSCSFVSTLQQFSFGSGCCSPSKMPECEVETAMKAVTIEDSNVVAQNVTTKSHAEFLADRMPFYQKRIELFEQFFKREQAKVEAAKAANVQIMVVMPDGAEKPAVKGVTTPMDIANAYTSKSFVKKVVVAQVDGEAWDLLRPLEADCALKLFTFSDPEGSDAFWHSSAHVLGEALEQLYGVDLTVGPALEDGFYYDCYMGEGRGTLPEAEHKVVEKKMESIAKEGQPFQRVEVSRDEAVAMFEENKFKIEILKEMIKPDARISLYRCGPMVDMCRGPHLPNTSYLKALAVTNASRAHWRGDVKKEDMYRVYGITFPEAKLLKEYQHRLAEAKKRDHRTLGGQHELFFFHPLSPGSCFFLPHGVRVYNALVDFIKEKYWEYDYDEVMTPNMFNFELWKTSGHADHYKANMFSFKVETHGGEQEFGLKPMNCPAHCVMFAHRTRSYRELPLRLADFGVLHRNEYSGALHGLTRVRKFSQDDAHIFCTQAQVETEVTSFLKMLDEVYGAFGLDYTMALSTRPEGYLGEIAVWDVAEKALTDALNSTGKEWKLDPGEGAFYGPKIDITVYDALRRKFQCATVQLDFQLPIRFKLEYKTESQTDERPVIVHRAVLGSVERMFAILTEHYASKWPLWLSPRQVMIVPISQVAFDYAKECARVLKAAGFYVDNDLRDQKMQKKVREAQIAQYNYILVVGEKEQEERTVNVRTRDNKVHGMHKLDDVLVVLKRERGSRSKLGLFGHEDEAAAEAAAAALAPQEPAEAAADVA